MNRRALLTTVGATVAVCCSGCASSQSAPQPDVIVDGVAVHNGDTDSHEFQVQLERDDRRVHDSTHTLTGSDDTPTATAEPVLAERAASEWSIGDETSHGRPIGDETGDDEQAVSLSCTWNDDPGNYVVRARLDEGDWETHAVLNNVETDAEYVRVRIEYQPQNGGDTNEFQFFDLLRPATLGESENGCSYATTDS